MLKDGGLGGEGVLGMGRAVCGGCGGFEEEDEVGPGLVTGVVWVDVMVEGEAYIGYMRRDCRRPMPLL